MGKGYKYKDKGGSADGISKIALQSTTPTIQLKAGGSALPVPIAPALTTTTSVTVQLRADDAPGSACFSSTLGTIKKQTAESFKAK